MMEKITQMNDMLSSKRYEAACKVCMAVKGSIEFFMEAIEVSVKKWDGFGEAPAVPTAFLFKEQRLYALLPQKGIVAIHDGQYGVCHEPTFERVMLEAGWRKEQDGSYTLA